MAARRVPLVFRFWHFHIHRASVLFDLQRRSQQRATAFRNERLAYSNASFRSNRVGRAATLCQARALRKPCGGASSLTPNRSPLGPRTGGNDRRERKTFGVQSDRSGRAACLPPKQVEMWGCKQPRVSTICKSWSYKPLAFQRFRLRGRPGEAATSLGMIVKNARYSSPLQGRSGARVVWQGRPSDRPNAIAPHWAGRSIRTR